MRTPLFNLLCAMGIVGGVALYMFAGEFPFLITRPKEPKQLAVDWAAQLKLEGFSVARCWEDTRSSWQCDAAAKQGNYRVVYHLICEAEGCREER